MLLLCAAVPPAFSATPFPGICGSANGLNYSAAPTTNLCSNGTPSNVTGIGPWFWNCSGTNGGTTATCSAAQAGGIVYRSTDSGLNWIAGKTGPGLNTGATPLLVSPTYASDHTLFLGANGIYKSVDSGDTWTQVLPGYMLNAFAVSPAYSTDRTIFAGAFLAGVYKSTDSGFTWLPSNTGLSGLIFETLAISPNYPDDHTVFAGMYAHGVYKSTDGGASWSAANTGIESLSALSLAISPDYQNDKTMYTAVTDGIYGNGGPHYHIYRSVDCGATWSLSDTGISGSINTLKISPGYAGDQTLFAKTSTGVYKSTNKGGGWVNVNSSTTGSSMVLSPNYTSDQTLWVSGDNIFKSGDGGGNWSASNSNFGVNSLSVSPSFATDHAVFAVTSLAAPMMSLSPYSLSFNQIRTNGSFLTKQVTLSNGAPGMMGAGNLAITSMVLSGTDAGQFSIAPGSCNILTPTVTSGGQCSFDVTFTPTSSGNKSAMLTMTPYFDAFNPPAHITLNGTGIAPGVCGSDNGKALAALAPVNLCAIGSTPSVLSGTGHPWSWTCQGDAGTDPTQCGASIQTNSLTVSVPEAVGKGDVQADIASNDEPAAIGIFCPKGFCSAKYDFGKTVRLTATPDPVSLFTSWENGCSADPCDIVMTGPKAVTANFDRDYYFKNVTNGEIENIPGNALLTADPGDEIRMLATELTVNDLILDKPLALTGGWRAQHQSQSTVPTTLIGTITLQYGGVEDAASFMTNTIVEGSIAVQNGCLKVNGVKVREKAQIP